MNKISKIRTFSVIFVIITSFFLLPLSANFLNYSPINPAKQSEFIHSSAETVYNQEWLSNNNFSTQDDWFYNQGAQGDNSTTNANISGGSANFIVVGEDSSFSSTAGKANSSSWYGWDIYNNSDYLLPDVAVINSTGCYVYHFLDENEDGGAGQVHNFPSVHFRKNLSLPDDMSDNEITSASLEVFFNATVEDTVDTPGDSPLPQEAIWDSATFYVEIADLNLSYAFRVAENKTSDLGQDSPSILTINDRELTYVSENDLITALNLALEKDTSHSDFTIIMGIDIYCEDNDFPDYDEWNALIFNSFNLTFSYKRKVDQFSSISWNQIGNTISGPNIHVSDANLKFRYRIDQAWPASLSPFSEIRIIINNNQHPEIVRLSSANTSWQDAKVGGFDVTNLILKETNISVSLQVFIANTFSLSDNITISMDDVYLNITYVESFADYGTESQLFLENANKTSDPFIQVPLGKTVNITIKYLDNQTGTHISGANVQLSGKVSGQLDENGPLKQYSRIIDSNDLGIGIWSLTVTAQMSNYETQIIPFFVDVVERLTDLQLFVDNVPKTTNNTVKIKYNEVMNITIFYQDDLTSQHLSEANVTITSFGILTENYTLEQYTILINSNALNLGFNVLTINAQSENYTSQMIQLYVEVFERATEFELYVNDDQKANNDIIQIEVNQILNLTVFYRDDITKAHLIGAVVALLTFGNFSDIESQYNYTLNSNNLSLGFNVLSINAQFGNYESQNIQIYVEVYDIASELLLEVDGAPTSALETIQVEVNQFKNLTVFYREDVTKLHISGAIVSLDWDNFTVIGSQHYYNLDTNDLDQGITIVTIEAQYHNYQSQSIQFYFEVTERDTELEVYVDDLQRSEAETISADVNQILNITVFYRDNISKTHLSGAIVTVLGGNFSETSNQFNYSLDTNTLEQGITILTVIAYLENYQPRSLQFYIKVSEKDSEISLYLNSDNKTNDPVYELPFGGSLNITVIYLDNQSHISGATIQLIGEYSENLTENLAMNQYTLILDTAFLKVGVNLFTIIAHANNYQVKTLNLRITLNKIAALINTTSGESYFSISPSKSILLSIILIDSDFGGTITNANVTYRWAYGQGTLSDPEDDGIYIVELENIPTGTYEIIITASAGDDYNFNIYRITLNVVSGGAPTDFTLLFISLAGGLVALVIGFTLYEVRFKYPPLVRKSRKIRKKIKKGKKTKPIKDITSREDLIKSYTESNVENMQFEKKTENGLKDK
ncbi:MAG: hypothetical protein HWN80_03635 [Candidatus Lokiarchaeota archaeon]|nr:hypothetical protein [Candidatus Lokiarchaeota archaeon]